MTAIRDTAKERGIPLFINARTDLFLGQGREPEASVNEASERARAYASAGASGFFIPGLTEDTFIGRIAKDSPLPVNVMVMGGVSPADRLAELGVARVSYGPIPYIEAMKTLQKKAGKLLS